MNSSVKIIKRDKDEISTEVQAGHDQRTITQSTREIRRTVKGWVAELHRRRRDEELATSAFRKMRVTLPLIVLFILCVGTESNCQQFREGNYIVDSPQQPERVAKKVAGGRSPRRPPGMRD